MRSALGLVLVVACSADAAPRTETSHARLEAATGGWTSAGALHTPRYRHTAVNLPNGDILVAGGLTPDPIAIEVATSTVEIFSKGAWTAGAPMNHARALHTATSLPNGDVLVTGGFDADINGQTILGSAEIYEVATGTWRDTADLVTPRAGHTATALGDGTVLIAAGFDNTGVHFSDAEVFSPAAGGKFTAAGETNESRFFHVAVPLSNGRVLLGGGTEPYTGALASLELYTAGVGWAKASDLAEMSVRRTLLAATLVPDGDVLFAGGYNDPDGTLTSIERYRPSTNAWTMETGQLTRPRYDSVPALLPDGRALFIGGQSTTSEFNDADLFDPQTSDVARVPTMSAARSFGHTANVLGDGRVLVAGGYQQRGSITLASADLFDLDADGGLSPTIEEMELDAGVDAAAPDASTKGPDQLDASPPAASAPDAASDASPSPGPAPIGGNDVATFRAGGSGCNVGEAPPESAGALMLALTALLMMRRRGERNAVPPRSGVGMGVE